MSDVLHTAEIAAIRIIFIHLLFAMIIINSGKGAQPFAVVGVADIADLQKMGGGRVFIARSIAIKQGLIVYIIYHHIYGAILIEIGIGYTIGEIGLLQPPGC